tara:strand:+ start:149 stop:700 length:552 start_codon:yes stop_codon:yes gene_type:complete
MSLFESPEKKIRTFFSEDYPQFLIKIFIIINYIKRIQPIDDSKRSDAIKQVKEILKLFENIQSKYKSLDQKSLDIFNNENGLEKLDITKERTLIGDIITIRANNIYFDSRFNDELFPLIEGRITEFLNNEKLKPKREQLQNLIDQQPVSSIPGGGKRKTNKKKRVKRKNSQRKRKSKRVNRKM